MVRCARLAISTAELEAALESLSRAPRQAAVLRWLAQQSTAVPLSSITAATQASSTTLRELERRGLVQLESQEQRRDPLANTPTSSDQPPMLTADQQRAYTTIVAVLEHRRQERDSRGLAREDQRQQYGDAKNCGACAPLPPRGRGGAMPFDKLRDRLPKGVGGEGHLELPNDLSTMRDQVGADVPSATFLLHGVTGSGKTEVYLRVIARALRLGRQALVLVPEIALTAQLVRRFAARFPGQLAVLHSALGLGERYDEWRRLRRGEARVAIGSRSAVFAPLPDLGLIVVDEEHELSYKHDSSPRYHARDVALQLAALTGSVTILGSATPAVESFQRAQQGDYQLLTLHERVGGSIGVDGLPRSQALPLPRVRIVDMRHELQEGNRSIFSQALQQALRTSLERNEQSILFLNRRGAASFILCRDCGHIIGCENCSSAMTVHYDEHDHEQTQAASSTLICHSCAARAPMPYICPACLSRRIRSFGIGTQRVVEEVTALLPNARVLRWDRDSSGGKGAHERMLDAMLHGEVDILVGTQMIAKGLDLPLVGLVGVVAADTGLHLPDFRSGERAFQLLTQVAGRAGRRSAEGQVIIQSYDPEHYALRAAQEHDYAAFFSQEIAFRRETGYPPFSRLVRFIHAASDAARAQREAEHLAAQLERSIKQRKLNGWGIVGPAPACIQRSRGRWRWHLILRVPSHAQEAALHNLLDDLLPAPGWIVDVDPVHVL
ncbi:primosomal protein N' [Candidatus Viridilinea mediisalina]|uniref:Replication restart protein PriA n=2 Tax=Candidatus Viridilinea mediisalina TaxID=2024553 RepID=A0A2A6RIU3_9CHLR|nr:primosomal protein N' [Candidatus Viridilinea mediisalina]